jgi:hypothetical protein
LETFPSKILKSFQIGGNTLITICQYSIIIYIIKSILDITGITDTEKLINIIKKIVNNFKPQKNIKVDLTDEKSLKKQIEDELKQSLKVKVKIEGDNSPLNIKIPSVRKIIKKIGLGFSLKNFRNKNSDQNDQNDQKDKIIDELLDESPYSINSTEEESISLNEIIKEYLDDQK